MISVGLTFIKTPFRLVMRCATPNSFGNVKESRRMRYSDGEVKTKISGAFRTLAGAQQFARIRSIISTLIKQNRTVLQMLTSALFGGLQF
ncbi:hypothetical protein LJR153_004822 [Paenibacillus sp. LjRoot153]|uniref:hypothetical protein n=1 Tax=Paenibacillus sp. LjRoot153 TaxID=3342270 RepID=UPI003ECEC9EA